jgi:hypothetical protein
MEEEGTIGLIKVGTKGNGRTIGVSEHHKFFEIKIEREWMGNILLA